MNDIEMKQKIKEVREKFLSNNQIADIRQNISKEVEDRLQNLNSAQILAFEELKRSHETIDTIVKGQITGIEDTNKLAEKNIAEKIQKIKNEFDHAILKFETDRKTWIKQFNSEQKIKSDGLLKEIKDIAEYQKSYEVSLEKKVIESEARIDKKISLFEESQTKILVDLSYNAEKLENRIDKKIKESEKSFNAGLLEINQKIADTLVELNKSQEEFGKKLVIEVKTTSSTVEKKISDFDQKNNAFSQTLDENYKTVNVIIDERLKEFRQAQKAAFEELEAALNLLEKHQDITLTNAKNRNQKTFATRTNYNSSSNTVSDYSVSKLTQNINPELKITENINYQDIANLQSGDMTLQRSTRGSTLNTTKFIIFGCIVLIAVLIALILNVGLDEVL